MNHRFALITCLLVASCKHPDSHASPTATTASPVASSDGKTSNGTPEKTGDRTTVTSSPVGSRDSGIELKPAIGGGPSSPVAEQLDQLRSAGSPAVPNAKPPTAALSRSRKRAANRTEPEFEPDLSPGWSSVPPSASAIPSPPATAPLLRIDSVRQALAKLPHGVVPVVEPDTFGAPLRAVDLSACSLPKESRVHVSALVYEGKALGLDVEADPPNAAIEQCVARAVLDIPWKVERRYSRVTVDLTR